MTTLLIENSRVLDVHALTLRTGLSVLVQDGRIAAVGADLVAPEGATVLDARGMTLMPGLIDCHVHVVASSFNLGAVAKMPNVFTMMRSLPIMKGMLERGFTTVRDAGGPVTPAGVGTMAACNRLGVQPSSDSTPTARPCTTATACW